MTEVVYRTRNPVIFDAYRALKEGVDAYKKSVDDFLAGKGLGDYDWLVWQDYRFAGLKLKPREGAREYPYEEPAPENWRRDSQRDRYVPDRRRKQGKIIQAALDELGKRHPGNLLSVLTGMPARSFPSLSRHQTPGVYIPLDEDAVYVHWNDDPEMVSEWNGARAADPVDHGIWERIPLSEYYAAREADALRREQEKVKAG
jgi:hypothetical protein